MVNPANKSKLDNRCHEAFSTVTYIMKSSVAVRAALPYPTLTFYLWLVIAYGLPQLHGLYKKVKLGRQDSMPGADPSDDNTTTSALDCSWNLREPKGCDDAMECYIDLVR